MNDKQAEDFVNRFALWLLPDDIRINITKPVKWNENRKRWEYMNIEGADGQSLSLLKGNGNIETKQVNYFLTRGNDPENNPEPTGTISFELFQCNDNKRRNEWYAGWLPAICNAADYTYYRQDIRKAQQAQGKRVAEVSARTPGALVFALTDDTKGDHPLFSCVAFEDVPNLVNRLLELCPDPTGWGLYAPERSLKSAPELQRPATDKQYWRQYEIWDDRRGRIINNMWHVPFRQIAELATVTMIGGNEPTIKTIVRTYGTKTQTITADVQQGRLDTLTNRAKERGTMGTLIPEKALAEEQEARETMSKKTGIPADKLHPVNLQALEKLYDPEKLQEMKAEWENTRRFVKEATGQDLPTWDERNARQIAKAQQRIREARTKQ